MKRAHLLVLSALLAFGAGWAMPGKAYGQEGELVPFQLQRFRPATGPADYLTVWGTSVAPHLEWHAGAFFNYADDPLQLGAMGRPGQRTVAYQTHLDLMGSIGLLDIFEVGLVLPWTILQRGEELTPVLQGDGEFEGFRQTAINDLRMTAKFQLLNLQEYPVGLAFLTGLSLPFATGRALASDGGVGAELGVAGEYIVWETIRVAANVGFRYRPGKRIIRRNVMGNEITWGVAAHSPFLTERLDLLAEIAGAVSVEPSPEHLKGLASGEAPMEVMGALRYRLFDRWAFTAGGGAGLTKGLGAPDWRIILGVTGQWVTGGWWNVDYRQPRFRGEIDPCDGRYWDTTSRRLRFGKPECPEVEEEMSEEEIAERRAILDEPPAPPVYRPEPAPEPEPEPVVMAEPEPEPEPEPGRAVLRQGAIVILESVNFETASADIEEMSFGLLDDVARIILEHDDIRLIRVEGHTDSVGRAESNLRLSQARAESVREYLISLGVEPERLEAIGYGQSQPVADNSTPEGRAENRRVVFNILEMGPVEEEW